jgi:hypothetical protein
MWKLKKNDMKTEEGLSVKEKGIWRRGERSEESREEVHDQSMIYTRMECHSETHKFVQLMCINNYN